jgi:3-oxoacyl-[acyl-carrier-protein] synthase-3
VGIVGAYIKAISYYLPEKVLTNEELAVIFPEYTPEEIFRRTGIKERHISADNEIASDMAVVAANKLFTEHAIDKKEVNFLLYCAEILDRVAPATACSIQERLGLPTSVGAMDIPMGCSGYIYGLLLAKSLVCSGAADNVLLLAGECETKTIHPADHELRMIFGDAMSATMVSKSNEDNISNFVYGTDGKGFENLIVKGCNAREKASVQWLKENESAGGMVYGRLSMNGTEVLNFSLKNVPQMIKDLLAKENMTMEQIDMFIFHQASGFMLEVLRKKMKIPKEKFFTNIENKSNTVSATIPLALYDALKAGVIKKGNKVLIAGFGIGYSWGATILTI